MGIFKDGGWILIGMFLLKGICIFWVIEVIGIGLLIKWIG